MDVKKVGDAGRVQMTLEEITAVCDEAHRMGFMVAAHVQSKEGTRASLLAGVDTIEHGSEMDDEIISLYKHNPKSLRGFSSLITTLHAILPVAKLDKDMTGVTEMSRKNACLINDSMVQAVKQALENNINLGIGTDGSVPFVLHNNTWRELEYCIKYTGMNPKQAIYYATKSNAKVLGIDEETGSLEIGKAADFLILDENPLENIRTLSNPHMVVCKGEIVKNLHIKKTKYIDDILDSI